MSKEQENPTGLTAAVIVASTRAAQGLYQDKSGPLLVDWLRSQGFATPDATVLEDHQVGVYFHQLMKNPSQLPTIILTTGGTGLNTDDQTVEAVQPYLDKEIPGIMHAFWARGLKSVSAAVLSRGVAGVINRSFVMTLPGSLGAVQDGCAILQPILPHILRQLEDYHDH